MGRRQLPDDMGDPPEKIASDALDSKQFWQLRRGDVEAGAGLKAGEDRIGNEIGCIGEADAAAGNADNTDDQRQCRGKTERTRDIAGAERGDAGCNYDRQRRSRPDGELAAGAEDWTTSNN